MDPIIISAPGKVILHGEHAVVYGKAALATSVGLRCYLLLQSLPEGASVELELPDLGLRQSWQSADLKQEDIDLTRLRELSGITPDETTPSTKSMAVLAFLYLLVNIHGDRIKELHGLRVTVFSTLPAGAGLGSSAAYSVCLAAGFLTLLGSIENNSNNNNTSMHNKCRVSATQPHQVNRKSQSKLSKQNLECDDVGSSRSFSESSEGMSLPSAVVERLDLLSGEEAAGGGWCGSTVCSWRKKELDVINKWGFEAEKLIHGTPSGIDNAISTFGGAMNYRSGDITPLNRMPSLRILLVNTKVPRSTKKMVAGVRERYDKFPDIISPILAAMEAVVERAQKHFEELTNLSDKEREQDIHQELQELFRINQQLLNAVGVGHTMLDDVCSIAHQYGLCAKLTGGGGGGCAIALVPPGYSENKVDDLKTAFSAAGFDCWETIIGSNGVTQHCQLHTHTAGADVEKILDSVQIQN